MFMHSQFVVRRSTCVVLVQRSAFCARRTSNVENVEPRTSNVERLSPDEIERRDRYRREAQKEDDQRREREHEARSIERLLFARLERTPPPAPVASVELELAGVEPAVGQQLPLFVPQAARNARLGWQIARLALTFGEDRVRQVALADPDAPLAEGRWTEASQLPQPRRGRLDDVDPQSRVAAVLAGRDEVHPAETLMQRARLDAQQGRDAEARHGLQAARAALREEPGPRRDQLAKELAAIEEKLGYAASQ